MKAYQEDFIRLAIKHQVLCFGEFILKSGRKSPYFFNAGHFQSGVALAELGRIYAAALVDSGIEIDMVFGPAYKGIPLVSSMAIALARDFDRDLPYAFNRKEKKSHGEGGSVVGAPLSGKIAIVDDVITAGTAIREVMTYFSNSEAKPEAVIIGLDRQEKPDGAKVSAIESVEKELGLRVVAIVTLEDVLTYLDADPQYQAQAEAIRLYRQ